jgi:hypothetical protein
MKANGLIQMPNGEYLHESLAKPMLQGKRYPGLGDYGLPSEESHLPSQSPPTDSISSTPAKSHESNRTSRSPSILEGITLKPKRKRGDVEYDDLAAYRNEAPASRKRAKSGDHTTSTTPNADQDFLDSIANLLNEVNAAAKSST